MSSDAKLHSSVEEKGATVDQIITMIGGYKKTFRGVITKSIMQGEFTHFNTLDGRKVLVYTPSVLFVEVFSREDSGDHKDSKPTKETRVA